MSCRQSVLLSFLGGMMATGALSDAVTEDEAAETEGSQVAYYAALFLFYFICYFLIVFFNMALIHCANHAFNGAPFTLGMGISFSFSRIGAIASWAFVAATVGVILRIIEDRSEKVGRLIIGLLGMVWSLLTFFVVPVIAYENLGPIAAIKRSGQLFKRTWGERVAAHFAFGWVGFLGALLIALPVGFLIGLIHPVAGIVAGGLCLLFIAAMTAAAEAVFKAAAYQYAIGRPVGAFDTSQIQGSFVQK